MEALRQPEPASAPAPAPPSAVHFVAGLLLALLVAPLAIFAAMAAHEPNCATNESFWNGDRPTGPGPVEGLILGTSHMGMDLDVHALAAATGATWQRIARHAVEEASLPATYPRLLAASDARAGMKWLVIEGSPLIFDKAGCGRPELQGVPMRASWMPEARAMLGPDAELVPEVALGWLPHRWLMTAGRRHDLALHAKDPAHLVEVLRDAPGAVSGPHAPARWRNERIPDLTTERVRHRRRYLLGTSLDAFVPEVHAGCVATLETVIATAAAERTVVLVPPLRPEMRDTLPAGYRAAFLAAMDAVAARAPVPTVVVDATDRFAGTEDAHFADFDHLDARGATALTDDLVAALRPAGARVP